MSSCRVRDQSETRVRVPAIPQECVVVNSSARWFELNERVRVFDELEHQRMRSVRGHYFKCQLDGQVTFYE